MGRHDDEQTLLHVGRAMNKTYTRRNGAEMSVSVCAGILAVDPTIVYERSKKHGLFRVIPIKGTCTLYGKPVASMPRKRNENGVYLTEIGTDTAKEQFL
ncbi:terminase gpA endonuclease subunit [Escherichia coli]